MGVLRLTAYEQERDLAHWQRLLSLTADSRAQAVNQWIEDRFSPLRALAATPSLRLYVDQLITAKKTGSRTKNHDGEDEAAQLGYLRSLLLATAQGQGLAPVQPPVRANLAYTAAGGLALLTPDGTPVVATPGWARPDAALRQVIAESAANGKERFTGLFRGPGGRATAGFLVPVSSLPMGGKSRVVAVVYAYTEAGKELFGRLAARADAVKGMESYLCARVGDRLVYMCPLADGSRPFARRPPLSQAPAVAAAAIRQPGLFGRGRDYQGNDVLFASRALPGGLILVTKAATKTALAESARHRRLLLAALGSALALAAALAGAAWWHAGAVTARETAATLARQAADLDARKNLLEAVSATIGDAVFLIDDAGNIRFANPAAAAIAETETAVITGKSLAAALGPAPAAAIIPWIKEARRQGQTTSGELSLEIDGISRLHTVRCRPLARTGTNEHTPRPVLLTLTDVTDSRAAQKRREETMERVICALMKAIDLHDPYSGGHSAKVTEIAMNIGEAMGLEPKDLATLRTAATLCNAGKLSVPQAILTKEAPLTAEETALLRTESAHAANLLDGIDFGGPVLETIVQKNEYLDGSGHPKGLRGDEILPTARILAVANAYVAMTSPRAYRKRLAPRQALETLYNEAGSRYDRRAVVALMHLIENG